MTEAEGAWSESVAEFTGRLLELIGLAREKPAPLTAFAGVRGQERHGAFTVVGQAPKGWVEPFTPEDVRTDAGRARVIGNLREKQRKPHDLSTPFWGNARAAAVALGEVDDEASLWTDRINWTNLYRISPANGNPSPELRAMQQAICTQLLWRELMLWRPRRVLFMTGLPWAAPFILASEGAVLEKRSGRFVRAVGSLSVRGSHDVSMVIVEHPARKAGKADERAAEIADAFASFDS